MDSLQQSQTQNSLAFPFNLGDDLKTSHLPNLRPIMFTKDDPIEI